MTQFTPDLIAKAKAAKNAAEVFELAKAHGIELTEEEAKTYFDQLHKNCELSDEDLDSVAGGAECGEDQLTVNGLPEGTKVEVINGKKCPPCGSTVGYSRRILRTKPVKALLVEVEIVCECKTVILSEVYESEISRL